MYFLQQVQKQEIKETCIKAGNQVEYFISSETVSQSWLALYVMLFNPNLCENILGFLVFLSLFRNFADYIRKENVLFSINKL